MKAGWSNVSSICTKTTRLSDINQGALDSGGWYSLNPLQVFLTYQVSLAHGIIVPLLETVEDAKKLVRSAKFPPVGNRGFGSPFPMERFGNVTMTEYLQQANESILTIAQIETKEALDNVSHLIE